MKVRLPRKEKKKDKKTFKEFFNCKKCFMHVEEKEIYFSEDKYI